ncbi:MAG: DEAD/DEAH box helicase, partial [bacterium]
MVRRLIQKISHHIKRLGRKPAAPSVKDSPVAKPLPAPAVARSVSPPAPHPAHRPARAKPASAPSRAAPGRAAPASRPADPKPVPHPPAEIKPVAKWSPDQYVVPPAEGKTRFHDLNLADPILHAIADLEFQYCTTVQARAIPPALEGKDVTGRAQTGTGKTAAFLVAIFTHFLRKPRVNPGKMGAPRALILAPTREL